MTTKISTDKNTPFYLSTQVKTILHKKGLSRLFNYQDYQLFKDRCKKAFNPAFAIADMFAELAEPEQNDFNDYLF